MSQYDDDLYVFIPGDNPEPDSPEPLTSNRPPLPPPRPVAAALQLEKPHCTLQGRFKVKTTTTKVWQAYRAVANLLQGR